MAYVTVPSNMQTQYVLPTCACPNNLQHINAMAITPDKQYIAAAGNPHVRLFEVNSNNGNPVSSAAVRNRYLTFVGHKL